MAPEVLDRQSAYTEKSDMWSIGCIAYLLAMNDIPFSTREGKEPGNVVAKQKQRLLSHYVKDLKAKKLKLALKNAMNKLKLDLIK